MTLLPFYLSHLCQEEDAMKKSNLSCGLVALVFCIVFVVLTPVILYADDRLHPGEMLRADEYLTSHNRQYRLVLQRDGNLVLYDARRHPLWASNTEGQRVERCVMQNDGNLVLYHRRGHPVWASNTAGKPGSYLLLQNDGNLVIYQPQAIWASGTAR
jgi:hypothetical protein